MNTIQRKFVTFLFLALIILTLTVSLVLPAAVASDIASDSPDIQFVEIAWVENTAPGDLAPEGFTWAG